MKYLKIFDNSSDYDNFKNGDKWITPNVSLIRSDKKTMYTQKAKDEVVMILTTNGELVSIKNYNSTLQIKGLAILTGEHRFAISKQEYYNTFHASREKARSWENLKDDYFNLTATDGYERTQSFGYNINDSSALGMCYANNAYLGYYGEWKIILDNLDEINEILIKIGENIIDTSTETYYWIPQLYYFEQSLDDNNEYAAIWAYQNEYGDSRPRSSDENCKFRLFYKL